MAPAAGGKLQIAGYDSYALTGPIIEFRPLHEVGPCVAEHTINALPRPSFPSSEDMRLKGP
jgi:hypothetical protein